MSAKYIAIFSILAICVQMSIAEPREERAADDNELKPKTIPGFAAITSPEFWNTHEVALNRIYTAAQLAGAFALGAVVTPVIQSKLATLSWPYPAAAPSFDPAAVPSFDPAAAPSDDLYRQASPEDDTASVVRFLAQYPPVPQTNQPENQTTSN